MHTTTFTDLHTHCINQISDLEEFEKTDNHVFLVEEKKRLCKQKDAVLCVPDMVKIVLRFNVDHIRPFLARGGVPLVKSERTIPGTFTVVCPPSHVLFFLLFFFFFFFLLKQLLLSPINTQS
jgi:hypothetical protein